MKTDTIAAIATAISNSGIGIIRISGDHAIEIVDNIYNNKSNTKDTENKKKLTEVDSHSIHYGFIFDKNDLIDEVMVTVMRAPKSFTMEHTVEINCHGGVLVMNRILETVIKNGARLAEPGEFTKRAFLNGRIDLSRAEAVMDIIHSKNEFALKNSVKQLKGFVSDSIEKLREDIIYEIAFIESALDDPEHISIEGYADKLSIKIEYLLLEIQKLIDSFQNGKVLKEGINTVIIGKPNVGKSSLLNILVGEERAIVTDIAGTTRDILEESIRINGISLNIIDTAGIHNTEDIVEKIGVDKAKKYAVDADLIIYMVDASIPLDQSDEEIIDTIKHKKVIVLLNKSDLENVITEDILHDNLSDISRNENIHIIKTSTKEKIGIKEFENTIRDMFIKNEIFEENEIFITNIRHKELLEDAKNSLLLVRKSLEDQMPEDFYSIDLMSAYSSLGLIIGQEVEEDLVNEIFSKFCMGK